ncbi:unnamed protein product [Gongylonema pulchrum]|uniref:Zinc transporter 2 n=1 Tax=Gongylonema pulchrum TaxID=637853 RepID=A0A183E201_9BILA|nr:unnamed protein product [Gongylonema pulchrum]
MKHFWEYFQDGRAERSLVLVAILSAFFIVVEFTGGVLAHSLAIMTDAGHMLSDLLSFIISIIAIRLARSPGSCFNQYFSVDTNTMIVTAGAGVCFNIIMGIVLRYCRHPHSQQPVGHSHVQKFQFRCTRRPSSMIHCRLPKANVNVRAAFIHVIGDFVQSIGVLTAAIVIKMTNWKLADPLCTFLFSIIVLFTSATVIRDIFFVLMEGNN